MNAHLKALGSERFDASRIGLGTIREAPDGARTLCFAPVKGEERLGDVVSVHPQAKTVLEDAMAPLVARFATLSFTQQIDLVEPFVDELRWLAAQHGIDHVILPLWPESPLADEFDFAAISLGLPPGFILSQDESTWPHSHMTYHVGVARMI